MAELEGGEANASAEYSTDPTGIPLVTIAGELDISSVPAIEAELERITVNRPECVAFDLSALEFMDSSGIALLLRAAQKTPRIEVRNPSRIAQRVIQATGLLDVFHVQP
jgi:anti-sigma B factor antagonist